MKRNPKFTYKIVVLFRDPELLGRRSKLDNLDPSKTYGKPWEARKAIRMSSPGCVYCIHEIRDDGNGETINRIWLSREHVWKVTDQHVPDGVRKGAPIKSSKILQGVMV